MYFPLGKCSKKVISILNQFFDEIKIKIYLFDTKKISTQKSIEYLLSMSKVSIPDCYTYL